MLRALQWQTRIKRVAQLGWVAISLYLGLAGTAIAQNLLPVDEAFVATASYQKEKTDGRIIIHFDIMPGHYLYRDRLELKLNGVSVPSSRWQLPKGKIKKDPFFGRVEIFEQPVQFTLAAPVQENQLVLVFQGCSELAGICYPPTSRTFMIAADGSRQQARELLGKTDGLKRLFRKQVSQ